MPRGVQIFFNSCTDPARHDEYNSWYFHTHFPDLCGSKGWVQARRFVNTQPDSPAGQYFTLYDFDTDDMTVSVDQLISTALETGPKGRHIDCLASGTLGTYWEIDPGEHRPLESVNYPVPSSGITPPAIADSLPAKTSQKALYVVLNNCSDPARNEEFNRWYTHTHLPDLAPAKGLTRIGRYRRVEERGPSKYMALYEFETGDPSGSMADFQRLAAEARAAGRGFDALESIGRHYFIEIDGSAYPPLQTLDYPRDRPLGRPLAELHSGAQP